MKNGPFKVGISSKIEVETVECRLTECGVIQNFQHEIKVKSIEYKRGFGIEWNKIWYKGVTHASREKAGELDLMMSHARDVTGNCPLTTNR